jgi:hypothetical protein
MHADRFAQFNRAGRNEIGAGTFEALGKPIDLKQIEAPLSPTE